VNHYEIVQIYFNEMFSPPPWHFPILMTIAVVPLALMALAGSGAVRAVLGGARQPLAWLMILGVLASIVPFVTGRSQVFDNERLFMPVFPFLAALAGIGFDWSRTGIRTIVKAMERPEWARPAVAVLVALVFTPHLLVAAGMYPHLLSYYSKAVGSIWGARYLRLETTYWCEAYRTVLPYLNRRAAPGATVWAECHDVLAYYQRLGELRRDLDVRAESAHSYSALERRSARHIALDEADFVVIQHRQSGFYRPIRAYMEARQPVYQRRLLGVRLVEVYER
jgi:hypothetical protein